MSIKTTQIFEGSMAAERLIFLNVSSLLASNATSGATMFSPLSMCVCDKNLINHRKKFNKIPPSELNFLYSTHIYSGINLLFQLPTKGLQADHLNFF